MKDLIQKNYEYQKYTNKIIPPLFRKYVIYNILSIFSIAFAATFRTTVWSPIVSN